MLMKSSGRNSCQGARKVLMVVGIELSEVLRPSVFCCCAQPGERSEMAAVV